MDFKVCYHLFLLKETEEKENVRMDRFLYNTGSELKLCFALISQRKPREVMKNGLDVEGPIRVDSTTVMISQFSVMP